MRSVIIRSSVLLRYQISAFLSSYDPDEQFAQLHFHLLEALVISFSWYRDYRTLFRKYVSKNSENLMVTSTQHRREFYVHKCNYIIIIHGRYLSGQHFPGICSYIEIGKIKIEL